MVDDGVVVSRRAWVDATISLDLQCQFLRRRKLSDKSNGGANRGARSGSGCFSALRSQKRTVAFRPNPVVLPFHLDVSAGGRSFIER
jgi:hypothetical protein